MKKRIVSFLLFLAVALSLFSCGDEYPDIESTEEELTTVFTFTAGGVDYEVPYELYRTFFLQMKSEVDGGDSSVWQGDKKDEYVQKINEKILSKISDIYAVFALCDKLGIDIYSDEVEDTLYEYKIASVEGGVVDSVPVQGYGGDYDAYLASLREAYMNHSVQKALLRYSLADKLIEHYYKGEEFEEPKISFTDTELRAFYDSEECVNVIRCFIITDSADASTVTPAKVLGEIRLAIASASSDKVEAAVIAAIGGNTLSGPQKMLIGRYNLDPLYYDELTEEAFSLDMHELGDLVYTSSAYEYGCNIIFRAEKSDADFNDNYDYIKGIYIDNEIGKEIANIKAELLTTVRESDFMKSLIHSSISMN